MLTRWSDFGFGDLDRQLASLDLLRREMDRFFGDPAGSRRFGPRMHVREEPDTYVLSAEVPGLDHDDIQIDLHGDTVTVRGERTIEPPQGYSVHRRERGGIRFSRSFTLPHPIDPDATHATVQNGVLTLTLTKAPESRPRRISVQPR